MNCISCESTSSSSEDRKCPPPRAVAVLFDLQSTFPAFFPQEDKANAQEAMKQPLSLLVQMVALGASEPYLNTARTSIHPAEKDMKKYYKQREGLDYEMRSVAAGERRKSKLD